MSEKRSEVIKRKIYPDLDRVDIREVNKKLERFKVSLNFMFDDGIEFTYDSNLDIRYFPGDVSFIDRAKNIVVLSYVEGFSDIEFFVGGDWDDDTEPYISIPIYDFFRNE